MKHLKWVGILGAFVLVAGCNRNSDNASSAVDQNASRAETRQTSDVTPTSRDNDSTRVYRGDTNAATLKEADNTGRNIRDRDDATLTPGDQGNSDADRETTRKIRRAITSNDQLSTVAKNIKIITVDGKVTLRGPVNSEQEKQTIESLLQQNGVATFDNQLEVKTTKE